MTDDRTKALQDAHRDEFRTLLSNAYAQAGLEVRMRQGIQAKIDSLRSQLEALEAQAD